MNVDRIPGLAWLALLILMLSAAEAPGAERVSQTRGWLASSAPADRSPASVERSEPLRLGGYRRESAPESAVAGRSGIWFEIADAETRLDLDEDLDGFSQALRVAFDADVNDGPRWVYARLYLSYEGGEWNLYHTTDVFRIDGFEADYYQVETRLLEGYPSGWYDLLIELYDADTDLLVASAGPYQDVDLETLPLEDQQRDSVDGAVYIEGGGGGGWWLPLTMLAAGLGRRLRRRE